MPRKTKIDDVDLLLLADLQANSRVKNADLARRLGLAESSIAKRINWLEDTGVVQGYTVILGGGALRGLDQMAQFRIEAERRAQALAFEDALRGVDRIASIKRLVGHGRYMVRGLGPDLTTLLSEAAGGTAVKLRDLDASVIEHEVKALRGQPLAGLR